MDGAVTLRVPPGTPSGRTLRVRGKGVPAATAGLGDLLVTVDVDVPPTLSTEARKALEEFAAADAAAGRGRHRGAVRRHEFRGSHARGRW